MTNIFCRVYNLRNDGSNFVDWYLGPRSMLWVNGVLFVLEELLEDKRENSAE
jgi:hypothetical protein